VSPDVFFPDFVFYVLSADRASGPIVSPLPKGVVLSAACVAAGRAMSSGSLVHAVLRVEQLMTAGECQPIFLHRSRYLRCPIFFVFELPRQPKPPAGGGLARLRLKVCIRERVAFVIIA